MSKQANKTVIGVFVLGAILLFVGAIIIFGSGKLFTQVNQFVLYFPESDSVKGLNAGAPVVFRGVKIGSVTQIQARVVDIETFEIQTPVYIEIVRGSVQGESDPKLDKLSEHERDREVMIRLLKRGLRAQLAIQSFVTGQLLVNLDFHEDAPPVTKVEQEEGPDGDPCWVVPTVASGMQKMIETLEEIPIKEISDELLAVTKEVRGLLSSPDTKDSIDNLNKAIAEASNLLATLDDKTGPLMDQLDSTLKDVQKLTQDVNGQVEPLTANLNQTLEDTRGLVNNVNDQVEPLAADAGKTLEDAQKLLETMDGELGPLTDSIEKTMNMAGQAMAQADATLGMLRGLAPKDSAVVYDLRRTMKSLTEAMESLKTLADYLERHPESLLKGKSN